jgi:hypothetical protein
MFFVYDIGNSPLKTVPRAMRQFWARICLSEDIWLNLAWCQVVDEAIRLSYQRLRWEYDLPP